MLPNIFVFWTTGQTEQVFEDVTLHSRHLSLFTDTLYAKQFTKMN